MNTDQRCPWCKLLIGRTDKPHDDGRKLWHQECWDYVEDLGFRWVCVNRTNTEQAWHDLRRSLEALRLEVPETVWTDVRNKVFAHKESLQAEVERLREYGNHLPSCPRFPFTNVYDSGAKCRCGWDA